MPKTETHTMRHLARLELNSMLITGVLPSDVFDGAQLQRGTPIFDVNGELLFYRIPITKGKESLGYADMAASPALGAPLLRLARGLEWDEKAIVEQATQAAKKQKRGLKYDNVRFVAYSLPKVAVQFLLDDREVLMLEWITWARVPEQRKRDFDEPPSNFERWSFLDELPARERRANADRFEKRVRQWEELVKQEATPGAGAYRLELKYFDRVIDVALLLNETSDLHYSTNLNDHHVCYELRGQQTGVWCVAASVQMLLDFYRYNYLQTRLATELGLGTLSSPSGLPYANDALVVTVLENLTSNALDATMNTSPNWAEFRSEIRANRPLISFVPGHSRTVVGYTRSGILASLAFRGLLVYDPWPPNVGVITQWENFDATTYRVTYTAHLDLV